MRTPIRRAVAVGAVLVGVASTADAAAAARDGAGGASADAPETAAPGAAASGIDEAIERAASLDWRARRDARELPDGSTLTAYAGETRARGGAEAALRVEFVPRFGCAPGVELVVRPGLARRLVSVGGTGAGLDDDDEASFLVDGTPVGYPVLVDEDEGGDEGGDGAVLRFAFNGNERERMTLRLQLDVGSVVSVGLDGDGTDALRFSLLGSRRTLAAMESMCLTHEPVPAPGDAGDAGTEAPAVDAG